MSGEDVTRDEFQQLLGMVPEVVVLVDPDQTIRFINRVGRTGRNFSDVIGENMLSFLRPEEREQQAKVFERVLETREPVSFELPILRVDGGQEWYEGTMTPLVRDGRISRVAVMTRNVTDLRRAEMEAEALRTLVPVCSWCHRVQDEEGRWQELEDYVEEHSGSHVTHGMCPKCEREVVAAGDREPA